MQENTVPNYDLSSRLLTLRMTRTEEGVLLGIFMLFNVAKNKCRELDSMWSRVSEEMRSSDRVLSTTRTVITYRHVKKISLQLRWTTLNKGRAPHAIYILDENSTEILDYNHRPQLDEDVLVEQACTSPRLKDYWINLISFHD